DPPPPLPAVPRAARRARGGGAARRGLLDAGVDLPGRQPPALRAAAARPRDPRRARRAGCRPPAPHRRVEGRRARAAAPRAPELRRRGPRRLSRRGLGQVRPRRPRGARPRDRRLLQPDGARAPVGHRPAAARGRRGDLRALRARVRAVRHRGRAPLRRHGRPAARRALVHLERAQPVGLAHAAVRRRGRRALRRGRAADLPLAGRRGLCGAAGDGPRERHDPRRRDGAQGRRLARRQAPHEGARLRPRPLLRRRPPAAAHRAGRRRPGVRAPGRVPQAPSWALRGHWLRPPPVRAPAPPDRPPDRPGLRDALLARPPGAHPRRGLPRLRRESPAAAAPDGVRLPDRSARRALRRQPRAAGALPQRVGVPRVAQPAGQHARPVPARRRRRPDRDDVPERPADDRRHGEALARRVPPAGLGAAAERQPRWRGAGLGDAAQRPERTAGARRDPGAQRRLEGVAAGPRRSHGQPARLLHDELPPACDGAPAGRLRRAGRRRRRLARGPRAHPPRGARPL
ncbi:MAG: GH5, partial [uncultured Solirubrobacteraceae bacterium]